MTDQLDLLSWTPPAKPLPYRGEAPSQAHSETSKAAAKRINGCRSSLHAEIVGYLTRNPSGATDEQLITRLDMPANTLRPRRRELQLVGRIKDSGRTSKTISGRDAVVWVLTQELP